MGSRETTRAVEVGGEPDECDVTIAFYGVTLDPDSLTAQLGCTPTRAHRAGDPTPSGNASATGAWILSSDPHCGSVDDAINQLLDRVAVDDERWRELTADYDVRLSAAIFTSRWGCGFDLSPSTLARVHRTGAQLGVTFYADGDAPEMGQAPSGRVDRQH